MRSQAKPPAVQAPRSGINAAGIRSRATWSGPACGYRSWPVHMIHGRPGRSLRGRSTVASCSAAFAIAGPAGDDPSEGARRSRSKSHPAAPSSAAVAGSRKGRGAGTFLAELKRKAKACGGEVIEFLQRGASGEQHEPAGDGRRGGPSPHTLRRVRTGCPVEENGDGVAENRRRASVSSHHRRHRSRGWRWRSRKARAPERDRS